MSDSVREEYKSAMEAALQEHARRVRVWKEKKLKPKADQLLV